MFALIENILVNLDHVCMVTRGQGTTVILWQKPKEPLIKLTYDNAKDADEGLIAVHSQIFEATKVIPIIDPGEVDEVTSA